MIGVIGSSDTETIRQERAGRRHSQQCQLAKKKQGRAQSFHLSMLWLSLVTVEGLVLPEWEGKSE